MLPYASHRICTMSTLTLITLEINIYFSRTVSFASCSAIYFTPHVFFSSLFFKPAYVDRHDSEVTRAVEIDHRRHIDTRKCNVSIDDAERRDDDAFRRRDRKSEVALLTFFHHLAIGTARISRRTRYLCRDL